MKIIIKGLLVSVGIAVLALFAFATIGLLRWGFRSWWPAQAAEAVADVVDVPGKPS